MYLTPFGVLYFAFNKQHMVKDETFKQKYGALYDGLKTATSMTLLSNFFFTCRRLLLIIATVTLNDYPSL